MAFGTLSVQISTKYRTLAYVGRGISTHPERNLCMSPRRFAFTAVALLSLVTIAGTSVAFQPENPTPGGRGGQPGGEGRRGQGGEMRPQSAEGAMKSMNRALRTLKAQIADKAKKDENLQLINDMQRGAIGAKAAKLSDNVLDSAKDDAGKAQLLTKYRRQMLALTRTLLDVESNLLDDKFDAAKADLDKAIKMRDDGHKELGVSDD
jgi:hypothetical protein